jgi:hypothetical protein
MKLKQLSNHFTFWNKVWATHLRDAYSDHQVNEQAINEIILRRGKSFTQRLVIPPSLMRDISEKERKAVILDELSVHEQVARQLAMQMTDDDFKVMGAGND